MRVGLVQRCPGPALCVGHAQDAAEQLLDGRGRSDGLHRAQHVRERAVPALAQGLHGDDEAHRAVAGRKVQAFEFALRAGRHLHLRFGNVQLEGQVCPQDVDVDRLSAVLRLEQHDRPDVGALVRPGLGFFLHRFGFKQALRLHCVEHGTFPAARVLDQLDRHLDHVGGLQLLRRNVEDDVGSLRHRRRRELEDHRRVQAQQRLEAALGLRVVRFVDDHERLAQRQPVGERPARRADEAAEHRAAGLVGGRILGRDQRAGQAVQDLQRRCRHAAKVRLEGFGKSVDVSPVDVFDAKALDRRHDDHCAVVEVLR